MKFMLHTRIWLIKIVWAIERHWSKTARNEFWMTRLRTSKNVSVETLFLKFFSTFLDFCEVVFFISWHSKISWHTVFGLCRSIVDRIKKNAKIINIQIVLFLILWCINKTYWFQNQAKYCYSLFFHSLIFIIYPIKCYLFRA